MFRKFSKHVRNYRFRFRPNTRKVDFLICGTQKGGTTALDRYLQKHPEICMAEKKEVHYFDQDELFSAGPPDYAAYHAFFQPSRHHKVLGESTPIYMYWKPAAARIHAYNPDMKLIVILRNPIDRAYSHWNMSSSKKQEDAPFLDAVKREIDRKKADANPPQHRIWSYIDRGFYHEQLQRLWSYFPKEHVLILRSEDLKQQPDQTLDTLCRFLGVSPFKHVQEQSANVRPYAAKMSEEDREYLAPLFEQDIRQLEAALNWDCSGWRPHMENPNPPMPEEP